MVISVLVSRECGGREGGTLLVNGQEASVRNLSVKANGYKYIFIVLLYLLGLWPEKKSKMKKGKIEARVLESRWSKEIKIII